MVLCDTNVIIEFYKGNEKIVKILKEIGIENIAISIVTYAELIYGSINKRELQQINKSISQIKTFQISPNINVIFIDLMKKYVLSNKLNLPDSLIAATAIDNNIPLFTLNLKDFKYINSLKLYKS